MNSAAKKPRAKKPKNKQNSTSLSHRLPQISPWLKTLFFLERSSSTLVMFLVIVITVVYHSVFSTPKAWTNQYKELEKLQQEERQLTEFNESLKAKLSQEADKPIHNLTEDNPSQSIFLRQNPSEPQKSTTLSNNKQEELSVPIGY